MAPSMRSRGYLSWGWSGRFGLVLWLADIGRTGQVNQRANRPVFGSRKWLFGLREHGHGQLADKCRGQREADGTANRDQIRATGLQAADEDHEVHGDAQRPDQAVAPG